MAGIGNWTVERIKRLKELWAEGDSCSTIARKIGGISRSAVIGKAYRLDLPRRRTGPWPEAKERRAKRNLSQRIRRRGKGGYFGITRTKELRSYRKTAPEIVDALIPQTQRIYSIIALENHHCRWPVGDPKEAGFFFCGHPSADMKERKPYCACHEARAHTPDKPAERRPYIRGRRAA